MAAVRSAVVRGVDEFPARAGGEHVELRRQYDEVRVLAGGYLAAAEILAYEFRGGWR